MYDIHFQSQNSGRLTVGRIVHCASIVNVDPTYNYPTVGRQHLEYGMFCLKGLLLLIHPVSATVIYFPKLFQIIAVPMSILYPILHDDDIKCVN